MLLLKVILGLRLAARDSVKSDSLVHLVPIASIHR